MSRSSPSRMIPISCESEIPEWAMVELNGELLPPVELPAQQESEAILGVSDQVELGKLSVDRNKNPLMVLGSHQLKGKTESLKESFFVMEKVYDVTTETLEYYQVVGIIKTKYMFNQYPKVIMR
eukprot:scaffold1319_cov126-Cylindrotheca_fusiformis.AAC.60